MAISPFGLLIAFYNIITSNPAITDLEVRLALKRRMRRFFVIMGFCIFAFELSLTAFALDNFNTGQEMAKAK